MVSNENVIVTARLTKVFRDFWLREKVTAVSDLDLEVRPREVFGLLGPNGSGKSTTLKMILGLLFPTRGRISIFGRNPTDVAVKARIGFLPEESYLYPFLNAHETLDFYGRLFHLPRSERRRRADTLLEMVGLSSVAYRRVGEYSKGMQRRIGLAQALINDPDLLILDEPTSGMDPVGTRQFKDLIKTLSTRGKTIALSSHLLADVEDVCQRVSILYGGKVRAAGRMDELLAQQDQTQLVTDQLDASTVAGIRQVLAAAGKHLLEIGAPRDRLETMFLRVVREAQEQNVKTGGSLGGGQVAEFLRSGTGDDGREMIQQLVAAAKATEKVEPAAPPAPAHNAPASNVLTDLLSDAAPAEPSPAAPTENPRQAADRNVIDDLLGGKDSSPSEGR